MRLMASPALVLLLVLLPGIVGSCGHRGPVPEGLQPEDYIPVTVEQLQTPRPAGLRAGQLVRVEGYFWQYLDYDPFLVANYLAWAHHPLEESRRRWAALYNTPQMQGYYDRLVLTWEQWRDWNFKRLEHIRVYGRLAQLGLGAHYLQVHHVDRLDMKDGPLDQVPAAPPVPGLEGPAP